MESKFMEIIVVQIIAEVNGSKEPKDQNVNGVSRPRIHLTRVVRFTTNAVVLQILVASVVIRIY